MKEKEGKRIAAVDAFQMAEKSNKDLKAKLAKEEKEIKFVEAALSSIEKQTKSQWLLLHSTEDQLAASKEQIAALKRKLEEVGKAKNQAKKAREEAEKAWEEALQEGHEIEVAEIEDALKAEVLGVCRVYCALKAGFTSSVLRKAENIY